MKMMDDFNSSLAELRAAAALYDWYGCDAAIQRILECFSLQEAIEIAIKQLTSYLPIFEKAYPSVTWPREGLARAATFEPAGYVVYSSQSEAGIYDADGRCEPDANAFVDALWSLDDAYVAYQNNDHETSFRCAVSAIGDAIIARVHTYCADEYPEFWETFASRIREIKQLSDTGVQAEAIRRLNEEYDRLTGDYQSNLWLMFADEIENSNKPSG